MCIFIVAQGNPEVKKYEKLEHIKWVIKGTNNDLQHII